MTGCDLEAQLRGVLTSQSEIWIEMFSFYFASYIILDAVCIIVGN